MTGYDLDEDLRELAEVAQRDAVPAEPGLVRRRGERRRHRRYALTSLAAAAVVAMAGGAALSQVPSLTDREPAPVASAGTTAVPAPPVTPSPDVARTVGPVQLLRPADVPTRGGPRLEVAPAGAGRVADEVSVCVPDGLAVLRATGIVSRNFRYPGEEAVPVHTVALQFADAAAARRAEQTVLGWVADCPAEIEAQGNTLLDPAEEPLRIEVETPSGTSGEFAVLPTYRQDGGESSEDGVFETLGVTRVSDRLMLSVEVVVGMDNNVSLEPGGDPETGMPEDAQFGLVTAAAQRLAQ